MLTFPTLSSGSPVSSSELNTNFADCINATRGIGTNNLAAAAGIKSSQLSDRFVIVPQTLQYFSRLGATNVYSLEEVARLYVLPDDDDSPGEEFDRFPALLLPSGRAAYLAAAAVRAQRVTAGGGGELPVVWIGHNGTIIGNGGLTIAAADTDYYVAAGSPFTNKQRAIANGDYFTIGWGRTVEGAADPLIANVIIMLYWMIELAPG
jgi:hypothetical protein